MTDRWPTYTEYGLEFIRYFSRTATGSDEQMEYALLQADRAESPIVDCIQAICGQRQEVLEEYEAMGGHEGILMSKWINRFPNDERTQGHEQHQSDVRLFFGLSRFAIAVHK